MNDTTFWEQRTARRIVPRHDDPNPKQQYGDRKVNLALIPPPALVYMALAMQEGARKYGPYNWREKPIELRTYYAAHLRHSAAWFDGEDIDPESGLPHLGHSLASLGIAIDGIVFGNAIDNRPPRGRTGDLLRQFLKPTHGIIS